jgi:hypothetical protein
VFHTQFNEHSNLGNVMVVEIDFIDRTLTKEDLIGMFDLKKSDEMFSHLEKGKVPKHLKTLVEKVCFVRLCMIKVNFN